MKRVWIAISLLSAILALSFLSLNATHTITKTMSGMFEEAYTQATDGDLDKARETANDIQAYWSQTITFFPLTCAMRKSSMCWLPPIP